MNASCGGFYKRGFIFRWWLIVNLYILNLWCIDNDWFVFTLHKFFEQFCIFRCLHINWIVWSHSIYFKYTVIIIYIKFIIIVSELSRNQSSNWVNKATPLFIQCLSSSSVGNLRNITKLVEWPVVLRTPRLADVL